MCIRDRHPVADIDPDDPPVVTAGDALDRPGARHMPGKGHRHRLLTPLRVRVPPAGLEIFRGDRHHESGSVPADGGQQPTGRGNTERGGEDVVLFLRPRAGVFRSEERRPVLIRRFRFRVIEGDFGGEVRVEDRLQLRGDLGQQGPCLLYTSDAADE